MLRYSAQLDAPRRPGEHEIRFAKLLSDTTNALEAVRDGKVPTHLHGATLRAMIAWMQEARGYGTEVLEAVRWLAVEEEIEVHDVSPEPEHDDVSPEPGDEQAPKDGPLTIPAAPAFTPLPAPAYIVTPDSPGRSPIAEAYNAHAPTDDSLLVLGVSGDVTRGGPLTVGGGSTPWQTGMIRHPRGGKVRLALIGTGDRPGLPTIPEIALRDRMNDGTSYGVDLLSLRDLHVQTHPQGDGRAAILVFKHHTVGTLELQSVGLIGHPTFADRYEGKGLKWGIRGAGRANYRINGMHCQPVEEHAIYVDSPQGDNYFRDIAAAHVGRTAIQIVNRSIDNPGPPSAGLIHVIDLVCRSHQGGGGALFTMAGGHKGDVIVQGLNHQVAEDATPNPQGYLTHGSVVFWVDATEHHGAYLWVSGEDSKTYAYPGRILLDSCYVDVVGADREALAFTSCRDVRVESSNIRSDRMGVLLRSKYGVSGTWASIDGQPAREELSLGNLDNGRVRFMDTTIEAPKKVGQWSSTLTTEQLEALGL